MEGLKDNDGIDEMKEDKRVDGLMEGLKEKGWNIDVIKQD